MTQIGEQLKPTRSDGELLLDYAASRSGEAFAQLICRHGPMVIAVCRSVLGNSADAEDAAQAVFITLSRKAASLKAVQTVAPWLHRVARYVALRARNAATIRRRHEQEATQMKELFQAPEASAFSEQLHAALGKLPEKYRAALLLHHVEGHTEEQSAALLGCSASAVSSRLSRGRQMLRDRMAKSGVTASVAVIGALNREATAAPSAAFIESTVKIAGSLATGKAVGMSAGVTTMYEGAIQMLKLAQIKFIAGVVSASILLGGATIFVGETLAVAPPQASASARGADVDDALANLNSLDQDARVSATLAILHAREERLSNFSCVIMEEIVPPDAHNTHRNTYEYRQKDGKLWMRALVGTPGPDPAKINSDAIIGWDGATSRSFLQTVNADGSRTHPSARIDASPTPSFSESTSLEILGLRTRDSQNDSFSGSLVQWIEYVRGMRMHQGKTDVVDAKLAEDQGPKIIVTVKEEDNPVNTVIRQYWLDAERGFVISKFARSIDYHEKKQTNGFVAEIKEMIEVGGEWFPVLAVVEPRSAVPKATVTFNFSNYTLGKLNDSDMRVDFPPKTVVTDSIQKASYVVNSDDSITLRPLADAGKQELLIPTTRRVASPDDLNKLYKSAPLSYVTPSSKHPASGKTVAVYILLGGFCVTMLIAILMRMRSRSQKGR